MDERSVNLPPGYYLDDSDTVGPEGDTKAVALRRPDGSVVAVFTSTTATDEAIQREADDDYRKKREDA
jgi:hypothetical protein